MNKKGQGMSVNVIIIAAIALIVLVVLVAIFTGRLGIFTGALKKTGTCESLGGECQSNCNSAQERVYGAMNCDRDFDGDGKIDNDDEPFCCKPNYFMFFLFYSSFNTNIYIYVKVGMFWDD